MNKLKMIKKLIMMGVASLLTMTSLMAIITPEQEKANGIYTLGGGAFFRTSTKINVSGIFSALDKNGMSLNIEGHPVALNWRGKTSRFNPAQTEYGKYQFVGLASGAQNAALGNYKVLIGNTEIGTYQLRNSTGVDSYSINVNGVAYDMAISCEVRPSAWMIFKDPPQRRGALQDTREPIAYLVGIDFIIPSADNTAQENAKQEAQTLREIKDQEVIAKARFKEAETAKFDAEKAMKLEDAQNAVNNATQALKAAKAAADLATTKAAEISGNLEAQTAAANARKFADDAEVCLKRAKRCARILKDAEDAAKEKAQKEAQTLSEIKDQQTIATTKLGEAQVAQARAENTQNLEEIENAAKMAEEAYREIQKAETLASAKAPEIPGNTEAEAAILDIKASVKESLECVRKARKASRKIKDAADKSCDTACKATLREVKDQQTIAGVKLQEAVAEQRTAEAAEATQDLQAALKARDAVKKAQEDAIIARDIAVAKAETIKGHPGGEAETVAEDTKNSVKKIEACFKKIEEVIAKLEQAQKDAEAARKAEEARKQAEAQKLAAIKDQQTTAAARLREAEGAQRVAQGTQDLNLAQKAVNDAQIAYNAAHAAANIATAKAAEIPNNQEAQNAASDARNSAQRAQECVKRAEEVVQTLKAKANEASKDKKSKKSKKAKKSKKSKSKKSKKSKSKKVKVKKSKKSKKSSKRSRNANRFFRN